MLNIKNATTGILKPKSLQWNGQAMIGV